MLAEKCFLACNCFSMQCQVVVKSCPILSCFWHSIGACSSSLIPIWVLACPIPLVTAHLLYTEFGSAYIPRTSYWKLITSGQIFFNIQQDHWTSISFSSISQKNLCLFQRLITQYTIKLNKWSRRLTSIQALFLLSLLQHKPLYNHLVDDPWIAKEFSDHSVDPKCSPLLAKHFVNWVKHVLKTSAYYCLKLYNDILEESSKQWKGRKFKQIGETQKADLRPSQTPSQMQQPSLKQMCLSLFQDCKLHILQKQKNQRCNWIKKLTKEHGTVHGQFFNQHLTSPFIFLEAFFKFQKHQENRFQMMKSEHKFPYLCQEYWIAYEELEYDQLPNPWHEYSHAPEK